MAGYVMIHVIVHVRIDKTNSQMCLCFYCVYFHLHSQVFHKTYM